MKVEGHRKQVALFLAADLLPVTVLVGLKGPAARGPEVWVMENVLRGNNAQGEDTR